MIKVRGFTLIEVLISMIILAIGLLGLAALQAVSLRDNQDAYYYQQATLLSYEMQDRIRANGMEWKDHGIPSTVATIEACTCTTTPCTGCTATEMAKTDYKYWQDSVDAIFPAPTSENAKKAEIQLSSNFSANPKGSCKGTYSTSLCLITRWGRVNSKASGELSEDATYYLEVTP